MYPQNDGCLVQHLSVVPTHLPASHQPTLPAQTHAFSVCCCGLLLLLWGGWALKPECRRQATHCAARFCLPDQNTRSLRASSASARSGGVPHPPAHHSCVLTLQHVVQTNKLYECFQRARAAAAAAMVPSSCCPAPSRGTRRLNCHSVTAALALPPLRPASHHSLSAGGCREWAGVRWGWWVERAGVQWACKPTDGGKGRAPAGRLGRPLHRTCACWHTHSTASTAPLTRSLAGR